MEAGARLKVMVAAEDRAWASITVLFLGGVGGSLVAACLKTRVLT